MLGPALTYMLRVEVRSLRCTQRRSPPALPCTRPGESRWVSTPQDSNGLAQWDGRPGERASRAAQPDGVLIAHVHVTHVLCDCWMPSYPGDSGRIATSTAAHCTGPRQTLPRAEFEPSAPLFRFVHRRRAPPSTDAACPSIDQRDVTRDLLHPRSSSALSDRDHTRARAPRLLCSLVLHLSPSARSACASAWPHPGRGKRPLRWARVALSVSGCLPPGRFGLLPLWGGVGGAGRTTGAPGK